jgi:hypothetical protein
LLGPVQEDPQVVAIDAERPADLVFVSFLEKQPLQQLFLLWWQRCEDLSHNGALLVDDNRFLRAGVRIPNLSAGIVAQWVHPRMRPIQLEQGVVADRIHEAAEAARRLDAARLPDRSQYTEERLLNGVFDKRGRAQADRSLITSNSRKYRVKWVWASVSGSPDDSRSR